MNASRLALYSLMLVTFACGTSKSNSNDAGAGSDLDGGPSDAGLDAGSAVDAGSNLPPDAGPLCATLPFPAACTDAATTVPAAGSLGSEGTNAVVVDTFSNPHASAPGPITVYRPSGLTHVPVLFFSHAFGATDPRSYLDLFEMLASNGYAVVHVPYPNVPAVTNKNADRYDCLWDGFVEATVQEGANFDLTRVGFFGHSFGGGATPEMARRGFVEKGWGSAGRLMFIMAPWYSWGSGYDTLPIDLRTVIEVYADDDKNDHQIAVSDIWNKLPAGLERSWLMIRSDACSCGLDAPHTLPMTRNVQLANPENVLNAYDRYGVWRRIHALARYALAGDGSAKPFAYGSDADMGQWLGCGGRAVRPLESSTMVPITSACQTYLYPLSDRCKNADPGYPCP